MEHPESPECIPASSICSMIAPMKTSSPSQIISMSTSIASFKNLSSNTGESFDTETASPMYLVKSSSFATISIARPPNT